MGELRFIVLEQGLKFPEIGPDFAGLSDVSGHRLQRLQTVARDAEHGT